MTTASTLIIAEVAQSHDGSFGIASSYIDAIAEARADIVKFQMHNADEESTRNESFRTNFSVVDADRMDYWRRMEFSTSQWQILFDRANESNVQFIASVFSNNGVGRLRQLGVSAIKIASGELTNAGLLDAVIATQLPVFLSTGMSTWDEIDVAVELLLRERIDLTVMQCTSKYPTPINSVGLNIINEIKQRYDTKVGLSDHSGTLFPSLAAIALGVDAIEVHVVFDKRIFGPDSSSSITIDDLRYLVEYRDAVDNMTQHPIDKDNMAKDLSDIRILFTRSLAPTKNMKKGEVLSQDNLCLKKPGSGIPSRQINQVIGKKLKVNVPVDRLLSWEDLDE